MKKILGIFLSFLFISQSFAADFQTLSQIDSANFLADRGIITDNTENPDTYRLEATITRQEVMKIIAKLSGETISDTCE